MVSAPEMPPIFPLLFVVDKKINFGSGVAAEEDELDFPQEIIEKAKNDKVNVLKLRISIFNHDFTAIECVDAECLCVVFSTLKL
jgi:hypothetical protein